MKICFWRPCLISSRSCRGNEMQGALALRASLRRMVGFSGKAGGL
jgi:hypothetical protein